MSSPVVLINSTSMADGGARVILIQLLEAIQRYDDKTAYIVFCPPGFEAYERANIRLVAMNTSARWRKRMAWDLRGARNWAAQNGVKPAAIVSLQNTGTLGFGKTPQIVYIHQSLPFSREMTWSLARGERLFWFYRHIYRQIIRLTVPRAAHVVVQTGWMRDALISQFGWRSERVVKIRPGIPRFNPDEIAPIKDSQDVVFFYPTSEVRYKNIDILFEALVWMKENGGLDGVRLALTIPATPERLAKLEQLGVSHAVTLLGSLPYDDVLRWYASARALVFPSRIETVGLPLLEAARFGLPVLAADLPYAHDVCGDYPGAFYIKKDDPSAWGAAMRAAADVRTAYYYAATTEDEWRKLIELLHQTMAKD